MPTRPQIAVLISGSGSNLQAIIDACAIPPEQGGIDADICLVISNNEAAYGLERAQLAQIPTLVLDHRQYTDRQDYDTALVKALSHSASGQSSPDLIVLAGFMRILTPVFTNAFVGKLINIHPSLLPKYPGLHTHNRALEAGDTKHGATVHFVTEELDGGPPILQSAIDIELQDTEQSLAARVLTEVEHKIYPTAVNWILQKRIEMKNGTAYKDGEPLPKTGFQYNNR